MSDKPRISQLHVETASAIVRWIIRSDLPVGYHLKEEHLGEIFNLSRSPVRGALALLEASDVVERKPERGYFLKFSGREVGLRPSLLKESENDELYRVIANAWFNGEIPDQVSTAELTRRYGDQGRNVGRALRRLSQDGVIQRSTGKGWRLGPNLATHQAFHDSYSFRAIIEPAAIRSEDFVLDRPLAGLCRRRHQAILEAGAAASIKEMVDGDLEFHHLIAVSCGNRFLSEAIERQNVLRRLTEILTTPDGERLRTSSVEHMTILDALEADRREVAAVLMQEHLTVSRTFSPKFLRKVQ